MDRDDNQKAPEVELSSRYARDLDVLDTYTPAIITSLNVMKLKAMCERYGLKVEIKQTRESFYLVKGQLSEIILERLEYYTIETVWEKLKEKKPKGMPKDHSTDSATPVPRSLIKGN